MIKLIDILKEIEINNLNSDKFFQTIIKKLSQSQLNSLYKELKQVENR